MTQIAVVADTHVRGSDFDAVRAQMLEMARICRVRGIKTLLHCGDLVEQPGVWDGYASLGKQADLIVETFRGFDRIVGIVGNHDVSGVRQWDAWPIAEGHPGLIVARTPRWVDLAEGHHVLCVPWDWAGGDPADVIADLLMAAPKSGRLYLAGHMQTRGGRAGGITYDKPGTWCITRGDLYELSAQFQAVWLGDFHERQDLTNGKGGYCGAIRQMDAGEEGNPAGFEIYDLDSGKSEWVELNEAPRYRRVKWIEGQPAPQAGPGEILNIITDWRPTNEQIRQAESNGQARVRPQVAREERTVRAKIPPNASYADLLRLEGKANNRPEEEVEGLVALLEAELAEKGSEDEETGLF